MFKVSFKLFTFYSEVKVKLMTVRELKKGKKNLDKKIRTVRVFVPLLYTTVYKRTVPKPDIASKL